MLEQVIPFLVASILLTISPGPDILYVLVQSITNGKKAGLITTLGLVSGISIHTTLVAFGVSTLIKESETFFFVIKLFGASYLFYLAFKVWQSKKKASFLLGEAPKKSQWRLFRDGFIMNVLNPKVTIFFLAFFPGFLWDLTGNTVFQFYILGALFMFQALVLFGVVALLAGKISFYMAKNPASNNIFTWMQIFVFVGIGIMILI